MERCFEVVLPISKLQATTNSEAGLIKDADPDDDQPQHSTSHNKQQLVSTTTPAVAKLQAIFKTLGGFTSLFRKIQEKPYEQIDYNEKEVYRRLMEDLKNVEEKYPLKWKIFVTLEILVFLSHLACLVASLTVPLINQKRLLRLRIWQWIVLSFSIFSSLSVVRLITYLVSLPIYWWWKIDRYMVFFIHQIKQCVDVTLWFASILFVWYLWFRPRLKYSHGDLSRVVVHQITRLLIALDLGAFLWFLKNILYLKLEADLHYSQLFDRIRLTVVYFHGLKMIDTEGVWKFLIKNKQDHKVRNFDKKEREKEQQQQQHDEKEPHPLLTESKREMKILEADKKANKNIWKDVYEIKSETVPIWILRRLSEEYLFHIQAKKALLSMKIDATLDDEELKEKAEMMFKMIIVDDDRNRLKNDADDDTKPRSDIIHDDLVKYGLSTEEEKFLFHLFDKTNHKQKGEATVDKLQQLDGGEKISRDDFLNLMVRAFKNCAGLESTLGSSKNVFVKLNRLLSAFVVTVVLLIWLLLSSIVDTGQLALLFSPFVAATFVFGDSCRKMFEGLIFAFAMHPFDVGDRVIIDEKQMKVNELHILTSVFYKYDTQELVIYPNADLATKKIINLDITPDQGDKLDFSTPKAPLEDIHDLQLCIKLYLDENTSYTSDNKVVKTAIGDGDIKMAVHFKYLVSYLSSETKAVRKSEILTQIMLFLEEMKHHNRRNTWATSPVILEFAVSAKETTLEHIMNIKRDISRYVAKNLRPYKYCSKVVLTEVNRDKDFIKMALYLRKSRKKKKNNSITSKKDEEQHDDIDDDDEDDDDEEEDYNKKTTDIENYSNKKMEIIEIEVKKIADNIIGAGRLPSMWGKTRDSMLPRDSIRSSTFVSTLQNQSCRKLDEITKGS